VDSDRGSGDSLVKILTGVAGVLAFAVVALLFFVIGRQTADDGPSTNTPATTEVEVGDYNYETLNEIRQILANDYFNQDNLDDRTLYEAAINGLLGILSDSGTFYVDPDTYNISTRVSISGSYDGIGTTISQQEDEIVIVAVKEGGPAALAGIVVGDVIISVDGEDITGWTTDRTVLRVRGTRGTEVTVGIRHADDSVQDYTLTRAEVEIETVFTQPPAAGLIDSEGEPFANLGYIRVTEFSSRTDTEMEEALNEALAAGARGIILDLRSNPGGNLDATVSIADMFLDAGTVLTRRDGDGRETQYASRDGQLIEGIPIAVLIDRFSASAPELLSAALQDYDRATIIGEQSFGKATVNIARELSDGGALFVSVSQWLSPNGTLIDQVGVRPDIEITPTDEDIDARRDVQLMRAVDVLKGELGAQTGP
jgi:carboxyl-terminal processing protease